MVLGVLEAGNRRRQKLSESEETVAFRRDKKLWAHIKKAQSKFDLQHLQVCGQNFEPRQHYVIYPKMSQGEFLSLSKLTYADVLNGSKSWDRQSPLLATSELSR
jgi:hypothetical protein